MAIGLTAVLLFAAFKWRVIGNTLYPFVIIWGYAIPTIGTLDSNSRFWRIAWFAPAMIVNFVIMVCAVLLVFEYFRTSDPMAIAISVALGALGLLNTPVMIVNLIRPCKRWRPRGQTRS